MRQFFVKNGQERSWPVVSLILVGLILAACGETATSTVAPAVPPTVVASSKASALITLTSTRSKNSPGTTSAPDANFSTSEPASTFNPASLAAGKAVVLVGTVNFDPAATALSTDPATFPKLQYAYQTGGNSPSKTVRLQLDAASYQKLKGVNGPNGEVSRALAVGQKIVTAAPNEEVLQVTYFEPLGIKAQHVVGTLKYQSPEFLFVPEAVKNAAPWHLLINSALQGQVGDPAKLDGQRILLDTEKLQGLADSYYVSLLDLLGKGPTMTLTGLLFTYVGDVPGPTQYIGTNTDGYSVRDAATGKDYYLVLAEGLGFDTSLAGSVTVTGEKLVFPDGKDHYGLFFISSFAS